MLTEKAPAVLAPGPGLGGLAVCGGDGDGTDEDFVCRVTSTAPAATIAAVTISASAMAKGRRRRVITAMILLVPTRLTEAGRTSLVRVCRHSVRRFDPACGSLCLAIGPRRRARHWKMSSPIVRAKCMTNGAGYGATTDVERSIAPGRGRVSCV